ncbi:TetR/AcrR family transcriptional regulator [Pararobbsia silviterrae]|uniref:TetR/AcrR family transcriptional regulator n=2 Tax=Pararobbsia silviterrae TaxID=1792498 RepID=A0A494XS80_9BURK|nr:TetR/AcrR family transcriptional regulator [Pararobbsia silviterrae]
MGVRDGGTGEVGDRAGIADAGRAKEEAHVEGDAEPQQIKRARGRPRQFDASHAIERARDAFWETGFSGTSLDALSAATGLNRPSLYGAFGDKHALYVDVLDRYIEYGHDLMRRALETDWPLAKALMCVYDGALSIYFPDAETPRGCFLIGTALVEAKHDGEVRARLASGLARYDAAFERRLARAKADGELDADADPAQLARIASALLHSLALRSRAGDTRAMLHETAKAGVALICGKPAARARPA